MNNVQIVWNGYDSYELSNNSIFTQNEEFAPFNVVEVSENLIQFNDDGEIINENIFSVTGGKGYSYYALVS
jgi:hypothetical protein